MQTDTCGFDHATLLQSKGNPSNPRLLCLVTPKDNASFPERHQQSEETQ